MEAVWRFDKVHDEDSDKVLEEMRETAVGSKNDEVQFGGDKCS